jgi:RHS repeat-associated protein
VLDGSLNNGIGKDVVGQEYYELTNHLGNVLVTISDKRVGVDADNNGQVDYYTAVIMSAQDYYAFGMIKPGRKYNVGGYRYGFNGKENDNDVKGEGNQQDYGLRIYDPRLGRFLSLDPLTDDYPELTPYQFASNRPIDGIDLDGAEYTREQLTTILAKAKAVLQASGIDQSIIMDGTSDALINANTIGISDKLPDWLGDTDDVDDYDTDYNKTLYLWGRVLGDVLGILQGMGEMSTGSTVAAGGVAVSTTGVGSIVGMPAATVGTLVSLHGAGTAATATADLYKSLVLIGRLTTPRVDLWSGLDTKENTNRATNTSTQSAHKNGNATQANTGNQNAASTKNKNVAQRLKTTTSKTQVRTTNDGSKAIKITRPNGKVKDISQKRVKEFVPNRRNPVTGKHQVNFKKYGVPKGSSPLPGNRSKRTLTPKEQRLIDQINSKS